MSKRQVSNTIIPGNAAAGAPTVVEPSPKKPKKQAEAAKGSLTKYPTPRITTLFATDKKPIGWIFAGFYNGRSYLKLLTNRIDSTTIIGATNFRPFTNLKTKWVPESLLGENLWAIKIDIADEEGSFPLEPEGVAVAWANKIARSLLATNVFSSIELKELTVTKKEEEDFAARCATITYGEAVNAMSMTAIAPGLFEELI
jgi:hypothetical protein